MSSILQDLRFAARRLVRDRRFTLAAVAALALGIGATSAIFTIVNAVLLRSLPFDDPDRVMMSARAMRRDASLASRSPISRTGAGRSARFPGFPSCRWGR